MRVLYWVVCLLSTDTETLGWLVSGSAVPSLKIYIYDLPKWKDPSKFGDASKHADIRYSEAGTRCCAQTDGAVHLTCILALLAWTQ